MKRGFTIPEMLIGVAIIAALLGLAIPLVSMAKERAHQASCLNTLRGLGVAIEGYLADHSNRFPNLEMGRSSKGGNNPVLETELLEYAGSPTAFRCPADDEHFEKSGSSYFWNDSQSGLRHDQINFPGVIQTTDVPLVFDKEAYHGEKDGTNFLFADHSAGKKLRFDVGIK